MTNREDRAVELLDLPAADYFSFDEDKQMELQDALADLYDDMGDEEQTSPPPILVLGAPKRVNLDEQSTIPMLLGRVQSGLRSWEVNYKTNLHLFVKNLTTGDLWFMEPLVRMRRGQLQLLSGKGEPPSDLNARSLRAAVTLINVKDKLDWPMVPGRLMFSAIAYELPSNNVVTRLESNTIGPKTTTAMPQPYINHKIDTSKQLGTKIEIPKTSSMSGDGFIGVALQVSEDAGVLKTEAEEYLLPCHLILMMLDERPKIIPATVPVQTVTTPDGRSAFNAVFQVDMHVVTKAAGVGNYLIFLDAGLQVLGPYPLTITD